MMTKFLLLCCLFFSFYVVATSTMSGVTKYNNFSNGDIKDKVTCGEDISDKGSDAPTFECEITKNQINVKWLVVNNNNCSEYNINFRSKDEFYIECGIYGINTNYYYQYDDSLKNWFLYKTLTEYAPMYGDEPVPDDLLVVSKEQWSIDKTLLKLNNVDDPLQLIQIIENKYNKKKYDEIIALAKTNNIDMSKLSAKTVAEYNNLAFYYQQSRAQTQAVSILNAIIEKFPNRDVAYLNLGDAYVALNEPSKALLNYQKYIEIMTRNGKKNKIPARIKALVSSKN